MFDIERDREEEAVSAGALIVDTPTGYDEVSHDDELVARRLSFLSSPGLLVTRRRSGARRSWGDASPSSVSASIRHVIEKGTAYQINC
jgi:hypothetical protein